MIKKLLFLLVLIALPVSANIVEFNDKLTEQENILLNPAIHNSWQKMAALQELTRLYRQGQEEGGQFEVVAKQRIWNMLSSFALRSNLLRQLDDGIVRNPFIALLCLLQGDLDESLHADRQKGLYRDSWRTPCELLQHIRDSFVGSCQLQGFSRTTCLGRFANSVAGCDCEFLRSMDDQVIDAFHGEFTYEQLLTQENYRPGAVYLNYLFGLVESKEGCDEEYVNELHDALDAMLAIDVGQLEAHEKNRLKRLSGPFNKFIAGFEETEQNCECYADVLRKIRVVNQQFNIGIEANKLRNILTRCEGAQGRVRTDAQDQARTGRAIFMETEESASPGLPLLAIGLILAIVGGIVFMLKSDK